MSLTDDLEAASSARDWIHLTDDHCRHSHRHRGEHIVCILLATTCKRHLPLRNLETTALPGMFRLAYFKNNKPVPNCARAESRKTPGELASMSADWKQDHTAAMAHMDSDPSRAARVAAIEAEASRIFSLHTICEQGTPSPNSFGV